MPLCLRPASPLSNSPAINTSKIASKQTLSSLFRINISGETREGATLAFTTKGTLQCSEKTKANEISIFQTLLPFSTLEKTQLSCFHAIVNSSSKNTGGWGSGPTNKRFVLDSGFVHAHVTRAVISISPRFKPLRTLSFSVACKPFACHSYENTGGVYQQFPFWFSQAAHCGASAVLPKTLTLSANQNTVRHLGNPWPLR